MEGYRKLVPKTELSESFAKMTVSELQNYLHYAAETDEEIIDLLAFERIVREINKKAICFDNTRKIYGIKD